MCSRGAAGSSTKPPDSQALSTPQSNPQRHIALPVASLSPPTLLHNRFYASRSVP